MQYYNNKRLKVKIKSSYLKRENILCVTSAAESGGFLRGGGATIRLKWPAFLRKKREETGGYLALLQRQLLTALFHLHDRI